MKYVKDIIKSYAGGSMRGYVFPDGETTYITLLHQKMAETINKEWKCKDLEKLGLVRFGFLNFAYIESYKVPNNLQFESLADEIVSRKVNNIHLNILADAKEKSAMFARKLSKETCMDITLFINSITINIT